MKGRQKVHKVMEEFERGELRSSSGKKVTSRKQALAIAMSEAEMPFMGVTINKYKDNHEAKKEKSRRAKR